MDFERVNEASENSAWSILELAFCDFCENFSSLNLGGRVGDSIFRTHSEQRARASRGQSIAYQYNVAGLLDPGGPATEPARSACAAQCPYLFGGGAE